jgi:hypothetical protein
MASEISRAELARVRDWAKRELADGGGQPWSAFLLARLGETIDALLAGLAATQAEASAPAAACHASPRLVVCNASRESRSRIEPRLRAPDTSHADAKARAPVDEPVA